MVSAFLNSAITSDSADAVAGLRGGEESEIVGEYLTADELAFLRCRPGNSGFLPPLPVNPVHESLGDDALRRQDRPQHQVGANDPGRPVLNHRSVQRLLPVLVSTFLIAAAASVACSGRIGDAFVDIKKLGAYLLLVAVWSWMSVRR